jgi:hypothetical protein
MKKSKSRGSDKLGALAPEALHRAIGIARDSYRIERWWKYGQPRIDRIAATLTVTTVAEAANLVTGLIGQHGSAAQITFEGFPYGVPKLDGIRFNVQIDQPGG